jgi:hypothetical protein
MLSIIGGSSRLSSPKPFDTFQLRNQTLFSLQSQLITTGNFYTQPSYSWQVWSMNWDGSYAQEISAALINPLSAQASLPAFTAGSLQNLFRVKLTVNVSTLDTGVNFSIWVDCYKYTNFTYVSTTSAAVASKTNTTTGMTILQMSGSSTALSLPITIAILVGGALAIALGHIVIMRCCYSKNK